jgi:hypothetical protein
MLIFTNLEARKDLELAKNQGTDGKKRRIAVIRPVLISQTICRFVLTLS